MQAPRQQRHKKRLLRELDRFERKSPTGALPDFAIIGAQKGGTTSLYGLLVQHPYVRGAVLKELHFFDDHFEERAEFYKRCFPQAEHRNGRRTITGEATPYYLFHPHAPRRFAQTAPQARLIALLRNPVDRAYSHYQMIVSRRQETLTFEDAIEAEGSRLWGEEDKMLGDANYASDAHQKFSYLTRGVYVDQLVRWSRFFERDQILVLKSEDFYEKPVESFGRVLAFLDLPRWEPESWEVKRKGKYERPMDSDTRRRLEAYFEPHNKRLYGYLGQNLRW